MKPLLVLACGLLVKLCLGGVYSWSWFDRALRDAYGLSALQGQVIFGALFAVFTVVMVPAGRVQRRFDPRLMVLLSGVLFAGGYLLAGASRGFFPLILLGMGGLCGAGIGIAYVTVLTTCLNWFPARRGLVTGLVVAAFGGGAVVTSQLAAFLESQDRGVLEIFTLVGLVYGAVILLSAAGLIPARASAVTANPLGPSAVRRVFATPMFRLLCLGLFAGTFAGMLVVGSVESIAFWAGMGEAAALLSIAVFAAGNALGRIVWGALHDRLGLRALPVAMAGLSIATLAMLGAGWTQGLFLLVTFAVGAGFGSCFVLYPAQTARSFGTPAVAVVYPWIFLLYGLSGVVGPGLAGLMYDHFGSYAPALLAAGVLTLAAAGILAWASCRQTALDAAWQTDNPTPDATPLPSGCRRS